MSETQTPPRWPRAAASAAIFRDDGRVLIGRRAKSPRQEVWSLPGGHIEPGETARAAAEREVFEETAVRAEILGLVDVSDVIIRHGDGSLSAHYILTIFFGRYLGGEIVPGDDCLEACFVDLAELERFKTTDRLAGYVAAARHRLFAGQGA